MSLAKAYVLCTVGIADSGCCCWPIFQNLGLGAETLSHVLTLGWKKRLMSHNVLGIKVILEKSEIFKKVHKISNRLCTMKSCCYVPEMTYVLVCMRLKMMTNTDSCPL